MALSPQCCGAACEESKDQGGMSPTVSSVMRSFASLGDGAVSHGDGNSSEAWLHDFTGSFKGGDSDDDLDTKDEKKEEAEEDEGNSSEYEAWLHDFAGSFKGGHSDEDLDTEDEDNDEDEEKNGDAAEDKVQGPSSLSNVKVRAPGGRLAASSEGSHTTRLSSSGSTQPDAISSDESATEAIDTRKQFGRRSHSDRVVPFSSPTRSRCSPCVHVAPHPPSAPEADFPGGDSCGDFVLILGEPVSERPITAGPSGLLLQAIAACGHKPAAVCVQPPAAPKAASPKAHEASDRPEDWTRPSPPLDRRPPVQDGYDVVSATLDFAQRRPGTAHEQGLEDLKGQLSLKKAQALGLLAAERRRPDLQKHYSRVRAELLEELRALEILTMSLGQRSF